MMPQTRHDAQRLRTVIEQVVRAVLRSQQPRLEHRTVTAVHEPAMAGRGGTCDVSDGAGNISFGIRWYEHRPRVDDPVLVEVPPPGGTRRIVAIDREILP